MEHGFPLPLRLVDLTSGQWTGIGLAALLTVAPLIVLCRTYRREASWQAAACWFAWCLFVPVGFLCVRKLLLVDKYQIGHNWRHDAAVAPWLIAGLALSVAVGLFGMIRADVRLKKAKRKPVAVWLVFGLAVTVGGLWMASPGTGHGSIRLTQCKNNLKQIGVALRTYHKEYATYPASRAGEPAVSWRVQFLPYLGRGPGYTDYKPLWAIYDPAQPWDSPANEPVAKKVVVGFVCPSKYVYEDEFGRIYTDYVMLTGPGTFSRADKPLSREKITDGKSNTLAVVEAWGLNIVWTEPRDADVTELPIGINLAGDERKLDSRGIGSSLHPHGTHVLFADGRARFLNENIDPEVLKALTTVAGGEASERDQ
jgi:prepilin-type processing-associated H-X9-DG protein